MECPDEPHQGSVCRRILLWLIFCDMMHLPAPSATEPCTRAQWRPREQQTSWELRLYHKCNCILVMSMILISLTLPASSMVPALCASARCFKKTIEYQAQGGGLMNQGIRPPAGALPQFHPVRRLEAKTGNIPIVLSTCCLCIGPACLTS